MISQEELSRAAALTELQILDSSPELSFDRITRLAASVLHVPMAMISLVDTERVWLKSASGIGIREMPRDTSQCGLAMESEACAQWNDLGEAMPEHPMVAGGPKLRFYASAPIHWNQARIGMLCVADVKPRPEGLNASERECLTGFAELVEDELKLRMAVARADAADQARREWSQQFAVIADSVSDAICTIDAQGTICYANRAVEKVFGIDRANLVGGSLGLIFGQAMLERFQRYFVTNKKTLDWRGTQFLVEHPDGRKLPVEFSIGEFYEHQNKRLAIVVRDHSEQVRIQTAMEAREIEFRSLLENTQEVIFRTDLDGHWTFLNPAWTELTGFAVAESIGQPFLDFTVPEDRPQRARMFQALVEQTCPVLRQEVRYRTASGGIRWAEILARLIFDAQGNPLGTCGTLQDIHERRLAQDQQEEARKYAESSNAAATQFLSRVSHELHAPMNAILGSAQLLELQELPPLAGQPVQQILRAGRHLTELLGELLDLSRIESGNLRLNPEPVRLLESLTRAVDRIRPEAAKRGIEIVFSELPEIPVLADPNRLAQVLLNLLSNAVKYNRNGGSVHLATEARPGNRTRLSIHDTGYGMRSEQIAALFQPFERLDAERSNVPGAGLGLAVTKNLIELMDGSIGVDSEIDAGSTFWLELPNATPHRLNARNRNWAGTRDGNPPATVLYIDHHAENIVLANQILSEDKDFRLITADSGEAGFNLACEQLPDLILLDLHLPDITGIEVLTRLRGNPVTEAIPVAVLTADATAERQINELGVDAYVEKPFPIERLAETVERLLGRSLPQ